MTNAELPSELQVKAWMNPPDHCIESTAFVDDAFARMKRAGVRHLLVMDREELTGVVTDRDLRRPDVVGGNMVSIQELYRIGDDLRVSDVMTTEVVTTHPNDLTAHAAKVMVENKFHCLPVVKDDVVVGILTSSDLLAALVHEVDPDFVAARELDV